MTESLPKQRRGFRVRPFRAPWWLRGPHSQTLGGKVLRPHGGPPTRRTRIETPDDDFLDLDVGPDPAPDAPLILIVHGLEGSSRRAYVLSISRALLRAGFRPVAMNLRGCSGELNRRPRFYHSGETGDLAHVLGHLERSFPDRPLGLVGFSLGGNMVLKYLGQEGPDVPEGLMGAVTVSVPFDLAAGCRVIEEGLWGKLYSHYFLDMLRAKVRGKREMLEDRIDVERALTARSLWGFDDLVTAPLHGFRDAADYYERSRSDAFLSGIRVPTLLLQAGDDPFQPLDRLPKPDLASNPSLVDGFQDRGGHVGFVYGSPWAPRFWSDEEAVHFFSKLFG